MRAVEIESTVGVPYKHGRLFGYESAKNGLRRRCPYTADQLEAIRGWYDGWDAYFNMQPEWRQNEMRALGSHQTVGEPKP